MFGWFRKTTEKLNEQSIPSIPCAHEHWTIFGSNSIGYGTCHCCGKEVPIDYLFNNLHARMKLAIAEAKGERDE